MGRVAFLIMTLLCAVALPAVEVLPVQLDEAAELVTPIGMVPGREAPVAIAEPMAVTFKWDDSITRVVVSPPVSGKTLRSPAWVVTYDLEDHLQVAYRATAFRDKDGLLHIDARKAIIIGPRQEGWSPDSFSIAPDGAVQTIDDRNDAKSGTVSEIIQGKDSTYKRLLLIAMAIVRDTL